MQDLLGDSDAQFDVSGPGRPSAASTEIPPVKFGVAVRLAIYFALCGMLVFALVAYGLHAADVLNLQTLSYQQMGALVGIPAAGNMLMALLLGRRIGSRISRVSDQLQRTQDGDYTTRIKALATDEIGILSRRANVLSATAKGREQRLLRASMSDPLTGLPNRGFLTKRMDQTLVIAKERKSEFAVALIDLDRFKWVNDTLGHDAGDKLLIEVSRRMKKSLRHTDTVARLGGDEFVLLLEGSLENAQLVAKHILQVMAKPMMLGDQAVDIGMSIGIAAYPQHGLDNLSLMRHADAAMYNAKRKQNGRSTYVDSETGRAAPSSKYLSMLGEMRDALKAKQFFLEFQPKLNLDTGLIRGLECLVRWDHPKRGWVNPSEFVPIAEQTGFMRELTTWVVAEGIRFAGILAKSELNVQVSMNVSAQDIENTEFAESIRDALGGNEVDPSALCLEITESGVLSETENALKNLKAIAKLGIKVSVDDFGTGYASLQQLQRLPVNELKIDRSFVTGMLENRGNATIVSSTIEMARQLGLNVVAEGVETVQELRALARMGCDDIQGYYLARPMPANEIVSWIQMRHALHDSSREDYYKLLLKA